MSRPSRAQIVLVAFDPIQGHEQGGKRPAVILSNDAMNHGAAELVTVVPITTKGRPLRSYLKVNPPEGGLTKISYVICDQVRTISTRRILRATGSLHPNTMHEIEDRIRLLLDL